MSLTKKFTLFMFLLLLVPISAWLMGWHWDLAVSYLDLDYGLFLLTETGSLPYAAPFSLLLALILAWLVRRQYSPLLVIAVCGFSIISTQVIKSGIKTLVQEPRPFVVAVFDDADAFYKLPRAERAIAVQNAVLTKASSQPAYISQHQMKEVGYSFPSGHTIFAASWVLLFVGFCSKIRSQAVVFAQFFVTAWAVLMLVSRLRLGMHYPIDLFMSILLAWIVHWVLFVVFNPHQLWDKTVSMIRKRN